MKNSIFFMIIVIALSSCNSMRYANLPKVKDIDTDYNGSFVNIFLKKEGKINNKRHVKGELIAVDSTKMIVLTVKRKKVEPIEIDVKNIKSFRLYYAKKPNYDLTALLPVSTISHGFYLVLTLPVNLIGVIYINESAQKDFRYTQHTISIEELKMFARFPQGLPPNVKLEALKPSKNRYRRRKVKREPQQ